MPWDVIDNTENDLTLYMTWGLGVFDISYLSGTLNFCWQNFFLPLCIS